MKTRLEMIEILEANRLHWKSKGDVRVNGWLTVYNDHLFNFADNDYRIKETPDLDKSLRELKRTAEDMLKAIKDMDK